jgi:hypothetical protein
MKRELAAFMLIVTAILAPLYLGYYEALEDGDVERIIFIKREPSIKLKFYNIHANDGEIRQIEALTSEERSWIIDYCRYRLGISTQLKTQASIEICRQK